MHEEELPSISYRISTQYGRGEMAKSTTSQSDDLFGPVMNMCSKINSKALPNGIAIGDGLYNIIPSLSLLSLKENRYHLQEIAGLEHQQTDFNSTLYILCKGRIVLLLLVSLIGMNDKTRTLSHQYIVN